MNETNMDIVAENITKLKAIFPEVFCEGSIDFEKLQAVLGNRIGNNKYRDTY